ncbi:coatomer subunit gamma-like [Quercus lobata]|uniref:Coatomer gamma subunit appendage Ig-like subdomain domain-containing protein n=1 Tax=Quercus lobata TaxID=97700 RepID=A0A7N2KPW7_QUELO|nr:coatomer subunit gamma-like [Quercus lobata]
MDSSKAEEFAEVLSKPIRSLPYDIPGQTFVAFEKPEGVPAVDKFSNMLKFIVTKVDPTTGETEDDGVEDEYQLEDLEVVATDYMLKVRVSNFRNAWESMGDDYKLIMLFTNNCIMPSSIDGLKNFATNDLYIF